MLAAESGWTAAAPYPTDIFGYGFAQDGEDFYVISGVASGLSSPVTAMRRYNVTTNTWTSLADIPLGSYTPPAVYYSGKIYVVDGYNGYGQDNVLRIYDIATNTWNVGASRPGNPYTGYTSRGHAAGAFNGNFYIVGGDAVSIYNIASNTWSQGPAPPMEQPEEANIWGGYTQIGQYLYVIGGFRFGGFAGFFNSGLSRRLDMASNTWSVGPAWTFRRSDFALAAVGNRLIALGGDPDGGGIYDYSLEVAELDTTAWPEGAWVRSPIKLPSPRFGNRAGFFSTARAGGEIWSLGGSGPGGNLNEHLFLPVSIMNGGSSIVSAGSNGVLDPGETVTVRLGVAKSVGTSNCTPSSLTGTLQIGGGIANPSDPQAYGVICSDSPTFRDFIFTVDPALPCGSEITASLVLSDGVTSYGSLSYRFTTGDTSGFFTENFDGVIAPALPAGWIASDARSAEPRALPWKTSTTIPDTPPNDVFVSGPESRPRDRRLDSPPISIDSASAMVSFRHTYNLPPVESGPVYLDGAVLEISSPNINGGAFTDITDPTVGGSFVTGGYDGVISSLYSSPLTGRMAWGQTSAGYITTIANLGPNVINQTIRLRFRMCSGNAGSFGLGWRIDTVSVGTPVCDAGARR